jgi:alpha-ribazole phosphatase/probable phosphoglycerate mutase
MSRALFIRHAETAMAGRFCGQSDPALSERGESQLIPLLEQLSAEAIEFVYSSDLRRAVSTAEAIATSRNIPRVTRRGLREIDFGQWEGLSWAEIELLDAEYARKWMVAFPHLPAPEGESFDGFEARVLEEVNNLIAADSGPIAVVTHAGVLRVVLRHLCGCSEQEAWRQTQSYCSIVRYEVKGVHQ